MTASIGFILCFALGVACGMAWIRASRADRAGRLVKTILAQRDTISELREELGEQRRTDLFSWLFEDEDKS